MKSYILGIILALAAAASFASGGNNGPSNNCNGNGSCGTTNNTTITNAPTSTATGGNATATGGQGGSAAVIGSGNSVNSIKTYNDIRNTNAQAQKQGQAQGQIQGQGQVQSNSAIGTGNTTTVTIEDKAQPVAAFSSAPAATALCMVGYSAGVGTSIGGVSFGGSVRDEICSKLDTGKTLVDIGVKTGDTSMVAEGKELIREAAAQLRAAYPAPKKDDKSAATAAPTTVAAFESFSN